MDTGDVGASDAPKIDSGDDAPSAAVTGAAAPSLPTLPEPSDNDRMALEAALRSPAPVVEIPAAFNRPAAENQDVIAFATRCRRVIAPVGDQLVAVRPKPNCKTCNGSARWTLIVKGARRACPCVVARLDEALGIQRRPKVPAETPKPTAQPTAAADHNSRLSELETRLRQQVQQRDAALAPIDSRIAEHEAAEAEAERRAAAAAFAAGELAAEIDQRRKFAEHYEQMAREEREGIKAIEDARDEKLAEQRQHAKDQGAATAEKVAAVGERQRVVERWAERTRPTERSLERLRRKVEPVGAVEQG